MLSLFLLAFVLFVSASPLSLTTPPSNATLERRTSGLPALIPVSVLSSWTTYASASGALPLSDATLRPVKVASGMTHDYVDAPDGKYSMQAVYPEGSYTPSNTPRGGFSFYAPGPASVDLTTAKEATFGYSVYFPTGFDFVKGGKLPGLYGGDTEDAAYSCSGGRQATDCFSARLMWRTDGAGEMYVYLPDWAANDQLCDIPNSECNPDYGTSISRGAFTFATGKWTTVSSRVKLNDAGKANAELELFVAGKSVIKVTGLQIRADGSGKIRGIQMQTFFGGSTSDWASTKDQKAYFSDFSVGIVSKL